MDRAQESPAPASTARCPELLPHSLMPPPARAQSHTRRSRTIAARRRSRCATTRSRRLGRSRGNLGKPRSQALPSLRCTTTQQQWDQPTIGEGGSSLVAAWRRPTALFPGQSLARDSSVRESASLDWSRVCRSPSYDLRSRMSRTMARTPTPPTLDTRIAFPLLSMCPTRRTRYPKRKAVMLSTLPVRSRPAVISNLLFRVSCHSPCRHMPIVPSLYPRQPCTTPAVITQPYT